MSVHWEHSLACGIHEDALCTCKEDAPVSVPAGSSRSPVEEALDRLESWLDQDSREDIATVRGRLERLTEERDGLLKAVDGMARAPYGEYQKAHERAESAESEVSRLTAELQHTREGLRELREQAAPREWETPGHPMNDWTKREPILRKIDALLAGSLVALTEGEHR